MQTKSILNEKIFIAGSSGMVGSAIKRALIEKGFYDDSSGGILLTPNREDLDLRNFEDLKNWFEINKPTIVILSAAKVGGIYSNNNTPFDFILENTCWFILYEVHIILIQLDRIEVLLH